MKQRYETRGDLDKEEVVLKIFCLNMNCTHKKIKEIDQYSPDASFWRAGERVAIGEVKVRTCTMDAYTTYMISKGKVDHLIMRWHPIPIFLIVKWKGDGIHWVRLSDNNTCNWRVMDGGRKDRDDEKDIEPCYHIPIGEFTRLKLDGVS